MERRELGDLLEAALDEDALRRGGGVGIAKGGRDHGHCDDHTTRRILRKGETANYAEGISYQHDG